MEQAQGVIELRDGPALEMRVQKGDDGYPTLISGYGIVFDQWSEDLGGFRERIMKGAFSVSIETDDIRSIFNHNSDHVLGRKSSGTLRLSEDSRGVHYEVDPPRTSWAQDLGVSIERGDIRENSFGFRCASREHQIWEEKDGILYRTVLQASLRELGPQTFPAYPQTDVQVRSVEETLKCGIECLKEARGQDPDVLRRLLVLETQFLEG